MKPDCSEVYFVEAGFSNSDSGQLGEILLEFQEVHVSEPPSGCRSLRRPSEGPTGVLANPNRGRSRYMKISEKNISNLKEKKGEKKHFQ